MNYYDVDEFTYAESCALDSALRFIRREPWVRTEAIRQYAIKKRHDPDLMELTVAVLFAPAVVYAATGKSV